MQATTFPAPIRFRAFGLDATPTGSDAANDVVADFTGATIEQEGGGILAADTAVVHTPSQTLGSTFAIRVRGLWLVTATVQCQTAASVVAGLSLSSPAGELNTDPVLSSSIRDRGRSTSVAADQVPIKLSMLVAVRQDAAASTAAGALVRLLLSDAAGAGAAAASLVLPQCQIELARLADLPS